ncbi:MAG: helix-turn-helix transcriptional regulator [Ruminococcus sp.]|nr:helix-turn-helix transcriptional regulator [Ruminococcus sp.]
MTTDSIGRNIRKYRMEKKMRQEDLAEKTGLSANYIGMLERGEKLPALDTFISILNALGITADAVLCDVLENGYTVKNSLLNDKLQSLPEAERNKIYEVIDTLIKHSGK